jgi:septum formation protein
LSRELILASGSPRRADLLRQIGLDFQVVQPDIDETVLIGETPERYVERLAWGKATRVLALSEEQGRDSVVLAADTAVTRQNEILGKPSGPKDNEDMLMKLSGGTHFVMTGICVASAMGVDVECVGTEVHFREISAEEARNYARCGEGADKAGGYGIQGIGSIFAERIVGSYSCVVGLPLAATERLLRAHAVDTWARRNHVR